MGIFAIAEFLIIVILLYKLLTVRAKKNVFLPEKYERPNDKEGELRTFSWTLDSPQKTKLKGHLMLRIDPEYIKQLRLANPYSTPGVERDNVAKLKKMYFYMLNHPRTIHNLIQIVHYINRECSRFGVRELDKLQFVLDFVQEPNIDYAYDDACEEINNIPEYVRFPDETLYDRRGDCDCKSFLAASLFHLMGYNVLFMLSYKQRHAAICVEYDEKWRGLLQNREKMKDIYVEIAGRKYIFCETTSDGFRIGGIDDDLSVKDFEIILELRS